ncbi:FAD-dependent oxidoreductase, partial [Candidatus Microgenomates bacterium]|nr:FAD-dependent oxidoreductase [Candidatus Microgenomates bacterium]
MYDLIVIGSGPAGLTASIYASCFHLKHLVIGSVLGGQLVNAPDILNYPGFSQISGKELAGRMAEQVSARGGEIVTQSVTKISKTEEKYFEIETQDGKKYQARSIILATGTERKKLNVPGEAQYTGKGVYYCATCEKQDYEGKICAVVGGGNSAVQAAVELAQAAEKVYIIYRGTELRGEPVWLEQIKNNPKIEVVTNTIINEIVGDGEKVTEIKLIKQLNNPPAGGQMKQLDVDKIFIEIGGVPGTALIIPLGVEINGGGYIKVNERLETNILGVFAAGDLVKSGLSIEQ